MAGLASAMEKYNLVGNKIPTNNTIMLGAIIPFLRINRPTQSIERVSGGMQTPLATIRRAFQDIISIFVGINREYGKQTVLLDRAEREDDEQRQERVRIIRQTKENEENQEPNEITPQPSPSISNLVNITNILSRLSGLIRALRTLSATALLLARRVANLGLYTIRLLRIIRFFRFVPGYGRILSLGGVVAGAALERLLGENFENRAERLESDLRRFSEGGTSTEISATSGTPVRAEGGVTGSEAEAMNFFMNNGWTRAQAAGIVGNLIQESSLNPRAHNIRENAQGIAQWTPVGGRQQSIADYLGKPILEATFQEQLRAIQWELTGNERNAGDMLRQSNTVSGAAEVVMRQYERAHSVLGNLPARIRHAERLALPQQTEQQPERVPPSTQTPNNGQSNSEGGSTQESRITQENNSNMASVIGSTRSIVGSGGRIQNSQNTFIAIQPVLIG